MSKLKKLDLVISFKLIRMKESLQIYSASTLRTRQAQSILELINLTVKLTGKCVGLSRQSKAKCKAMQISVTSSIATLNVNNHLIRFTISLVPLSSQASQVMTLTLNFKSPSVLRILCGPTQLLRLKVSYLLLSCTQEEILVHK